MILSLLGASTCATIAYITRPRAERRTPKDEWQDWEDIRREASEAADHLQDGRMRRFFLWIIRICEEWQREIAARRRNK